MDSLNSRSVLPHGPPYGSNWGHKIVALEFCLISPLLLLLYLQNVLRGIGKAYVESLNSRSVLPPDPLMGQTGVINSCLGVFALYLLYHCFSEYIKRYWEAYVENLNSRSLLSPDPPPPPWVKLGS